MSKVIFHVDREGEACTFYCPGCEMFHLVPVKYNELYSKRNGKLRPTWKFNGDEEKPTFSPVFAVEWVGHEPPQRCHSIVRDGVIIYLVGSTHKLMGLRVPMRDEG